MVVPNAAAAGVYLVFIEGSDPAGKAKVLVAPVVVSGSASGGSADKPVSSGRVPACVGSIKPSYPPGRDAAIVRDVAAGRAGLVLGDDTIDLAGVDEGSDGTWLWAAGAAALVVAGTGVVALRRRRAAGGLPS